MGKRSKNAMQSPLSSFSRHFTSLCIHLPFYLTISSNIDIFSLFLSEFSISLQFFHNFSLSASTKVEYSGPKNITPDISIKNTIFLRRSKHTGKYAVKGELLNKPKINDGENKNIFLLPDNQKLPKNKHIHKTKAAFVLLKMGQIFLL
jgi:hypothetical protein